MRAPYQNLVWKVNRSKRSLQPSPKNDVNLIVPGYPATDQTRFLPRAAATESSIWCYCFSRIPLFGAARSSVCLFRRVLRAQRDSLALSLSRFS